jgi:tRNA(fMet)-specific endonuclease VapC
VGIIVDSSVLIAGERGQLDFEVLLQSHADETISIAAITASELLHGVHRATTPAQRARREAFVEHILAGLFILPFDLLAARAHASLWAQLASSGETIGAHDLLIAATALASGCSVATRDERSFPKVPGLKLLRW